MIVSHVLSISLQSSIFSDAWVLQLGSVSFSGVAVIYASFEFHPPALCQIECLWSDTTNGCCFLCHSGLDPPYRVRDFKIKDSKKVRTFLGTRAAVCEQHRYDDDKSQYINTGSNVRDMSNVIINLITLPEFSGYQLMFHLCAPKVFSDVLLRSERRCY